jgi:RNA recognition motif-containing protein
MGSKIYVGGLAFSITDDQLRELFVPYGNVQSARVIMDRATGRSKGFGFVEMSTPAEAQNAIQALNSAEFGGRTLIVSEARPQEPRSGGGGRSYGGGGGGGNRDNRGRW